MWDNDGHRYDSDMMNGGGWIVGLAVLVLVLLLVALVAVLAQHSLRVSRHSPPPTTAGARATEDPRQLLDLRLARGEVSPEEYRSIKAALDAT